MNRAKILRSCLALAPVLALCACASRPNAENDEVKRAFDQADANHDEQLVADEFAKLGLPGVNFETVDSDQNARVSLAELESYIAYRRVRAEGDRSLRELQRKSRY